MKIKVRKSKISSKFYTKNIKRKIRKLFKNIHGRKKRQKYKIHEAKEICFSNHLNLAKDIDSILEIAPQIDEYLKISQSHKILLNHSRINDISIGALLYLVGQISRINKVLKASRQVGLKYRDNLGINANNEKLKYLFYKIGYWKYFGINHMPYKISKTADGSYFLNIQSSTDAGINLLNDIKQFIREHTAFFANRYEIEYNFDDILKEAMANSLEHAYPNNFNKPDKENGRWWTCGHYDKTRQILEIICYDYGVGIRESISNNLHKKEADGLKNKVSELFQTTINKIASYVKNSDDASLIKMAIDGEIPKYNKKLEPRDRNKGFKRFKNFAIECGYDCELVVVSGKGKYKFCYNNTKKEKLEEKTTLNGNIDGMLIKWKLRKVE